MSTKHRAVGAPSGLCDPNHSKKMPTVFRAVQSAHATRSPPKRPAGQSRPAFSAAGRIKLASSTEQEPEEETTSRSSISNDPPLCELPLIEGAAVVEVGSTDGETPRSTTRELLADSRSAWRLFSDYVKTISVNTMSFESKQMSSRLSDVFRDVRTQLEREHEARLCRIQRASMDAKSRHDSLVATSLAEITPARTDENDAVDGDKMASQSGCHATVDDGGDNVATTSHGWLVVRKCIEDRRAQNRTMRLAYGGADSHSWRMLVNTVDQLTEAAKTRQHLYERYIYNPNRNAWADGLVNYPQFLLDRLSKTSRGPGAGDVGVRPRATRSAPPRSKRPSVKSKWRPASSAVPKNHKAQSTSEGIV